nr:RNA-binding protein 4B-like isoform X2 [Taeniopygia guttata]
MVKLFIGNLPREATEQEIRSLFEQYGKVLECDIIKNYGFVHIEDKTAAEDAIRNLHHHKLHGVCINVEASKNKSKASTKLHVGNISPACTNLELRAKFEEYGPVIECDIVKDYAFVHMERAEDAVEAIRGLDNTEFQGEVQIWGAPGWDGARGGSDLGGFWLILGVTSPTLWLVLCSGPPLVPERQNLALGMVPGAVLVLSSSVRAEDTVVAPCRGRVEFVGILGDLPQTLCSG